MVGKCWWAAYTPPSVATDVNNRKHHRVIKFDITNAADVLVLNVFIFTLIIGARKACLILTM